MKNIAATADRLAARAIKEGAGLEGLRDWVDLASGGDLDCVELDVLTDSVMHRLSAFVCDKCGEPKPTFEEARACGRT